MLSPFDPDSGALRDEHECQLDGETIPVPVVGVVLQGPENDPTFRRVDSFEYWMDRAVTFLEVPEHLTSTAEIRASLLKGVGARSEQEYVELMQRQNDIPPQPSCDTVIRGRVCVGDCLDYPEGKPMVQYMATNSLGPVNHLEIAVCGDRLVEFFATHRMAEDARSVYCEKYLIDSLVHGRAPASTCGAYRVRADCSVVEQ